jgi:hypothetical protein
MADNLSRQFESRVKLKKQRMAGDFVSVCRFVVSGLLAGYRGRAEAWKIGVMEGDENAKMMTGACQE